MTEPQLQFIVVDTPTQELAVVIRGNATLPANGSADDDAASLAAGSTEEPLPDPVEIFVAAARLHMFAAPLTDPGDSDAELVTQSTDPDKAERTYRLRLRNVHRGALRVLANLAVARLPDFVRIESQGSPSLAASIFDVASLDYPTPARPSPFPVDYAMPSRSSRNRTVQLSLARRPQVDELDIVYTGLETWSQLPLFGGYPHGAMKPWQSSAGPTPAFLLDPYTVEQSFPDLFLCDDDCYACVVNWAHDLHRTVCPVAALVLR